MATTSRSLTAVFSGDFLGGSELFNLEYLRQAHGEGIAIDAVLPAEGTLSDALAPIARSIHVATAPPAVTAISRFDRGARSLRVATRARTVGRYLRRVQHALSCTYGPICCFGVRAQTTVALLPPQNRPVGWVVHEIVPSGPYGRIWGLAARRATAVLAYSAVAGHQPLLRKRGVRVCAVRLDLERFAALPRPQWPPRTIGLIGDLFPLKNHLGFIEVVRCLRNRTWPITGLMVGRASESSPAHKTYAQRVASAAAEVGHVKLAEATPEEIPRLMAQMDVVLQLSTAPESFGRVCVEALAAGRPVIGFDHGGVAEILSGLDGEGSLCTPGDLSAVIAALITLGSTRSGFEGASAEARRHALRQFGPGQQGATVGDELVRFALREHP
jgi:glycosyltransferase involved in cell wall biosynthesis